MGSRQEWNRAEQTPSNLPLREQECHNHSPLHPYIPSPPHPLTPSLLTRSPGECVLEVDALMKGLQVDGGGLVG